ncbi:tetratricopeptide repeat protein [Micromonospora echinospora]|uniref:AfsR/SARP family transcriptional regulator n=1 Tax=Micromonospora echinospora TaxID=1877 RepID=UPI00343E39DA
MDLRLLGAVEIWGPSGLVDTGPARQRTVLAALAFDAGNVVDADLLIDRVWGDRPPDRARATLHSYLARLRRILLVAGGARLVRRSAGYLLDGDPELVDLHRFRRLVTRARVHQHSDAQRARLFREALQLWRGTALAGLNSSWAAQVRGVLRREYQDATLAWAEVELRAGNAADTVGRVTHLLAADPYAEPVAAMLMRLHYSLGRTADALNLYATVKSRLAEELGADPSQELQAVHQLVLRGDASPAAPWPAGPAVGPTLLPLDTYGFVGRKEPLDRLDEALTRAGRQSTAVPLCLVTGPPGVGKTALAVHWAHRVRDRFPGGQIYVNLRGFHPSGTPVSTSEAFHILLTAIGVPPARIPADPDAQAALYRTVLADRRVLVLLDNARDADQVRPLLPAAPGSLALITSRHELASLVAIEAAHPVPVGLLTSDEARALLAERLGTDRTAAEPDAVNMVVDRCARLPLALAIAAARAATRPGVPLADLAADLASDDVTGSVTGPGRLDTLSTGEPGADIRAVFACSYDALRPDTARLFRLLGLHPGADLRTPAAASLAGLPIAQTAPLLAELMRAHLIEEPARGRYSCHDLLRAYAADRTADEDSVPARRDAITRLFDHFLHNAEYAVGVLFPAEQKSPSRTSAPAITFDGPAAARAWLDAERANIAALACHEEVHDWPGRTTALVTTLYRYLDSGHCTDALLLHTRAYDAARHAGDHAAEARAHNDIGQAYRRSGRFGHALSRHRQALSLFQRVGDRAGEARTLGHLGVTQWRLGDYPQCRQFHQASLDLYREIGDRLGEANQLNVFGFGHRQLGQYAKAVELHLQALALFRELDDRLDEADTLNHLGTSYQQQGRFPEAVDCIGRAIEVFRELGYQPGEVHALNNLGHTLLRSGQHRAACEHHRRALSLAREIGERVYEAEALNGLGMALLAVGDIETARARLHAALSLAERTGDRREQANAHDGLAHICRHVGDVGQARRHWEAALAVYAELGLPEADRIADQINEL